MPTRRRTPTLTTGTIAELARLRDEGVRRRFLSTRPSLVHETIVEQLTQVVAERVRVDVHEAAALADAAVLIAQRLQTDASMAMALRARANAHWFNHELKQAADLFETSAQLFERVGSTSELGRTLSSSIQSLILLGEYDRALAAAERARGLFTTLGDERRLARLEINFANILHRQERLADALDRYEHALERLLPLQDTEAVGVALHNMAVCLIVLNDFDRALTTYERAREHCQRAGMPGLVAQADYNIAYLYFFRGDYSRALDMLRTVRVACHAAGDRYHAALCDLDQSDIYLELNLSAEAAEMAQSAQGQFEALGNGYEAARSVTNLAIALGQQREFFRSLELFADGRARFEREQNAVWPSVIDLYQALVLDNAGRYFEARRLAQAALAFFRDSPLHRKTILCELLLARLARQIGEHDAALDHSRAAIARAEAIDAPVLDYQAYFLRGQIEEDAGDPAAAYGSYQTARTRLEALRSVLWGEDLKIAFMTTKLVVYERLIALCLARDGDEPRLAEEIFGYVEQAKARSLRDQFFERVSPMPTDAGQSELVRQIRTLREELNWYYHRVEIEQLGRDERSPERLELLHAQLKDREHAFIRILRELPAGDRESVGLSEASPVSIEALRRVLGPDAALVEYFAVGDRILAAVVTHDRLEIVPLTTAMQVRHALRLLQFQLSKFQYGPEYLTKAGEGLLAATNAHLQELHEELFVPLDIGGIRRLVIVPHDHLHYVPFHALFDGERYVADAQAVCYAPSATIYALCRNRADAAVAGGHAKAQALVLGVPDARAPFILDEVKAVAGILLEAHLRVGPDATSAVLREIGPASRLIHIATHGSFREDAPLFSGVRLGDSMLTLHDLYDLRLDADLVTLSGCGTGLQALAEGDELRGLTRGLLAGGARSVLATLWNVNDYSTAAFMRAFYRRLQAGEEGAAAVQGSMVELRESWPHPYYWAPFILTGADRQMTYNFR